MRATYRARRDALVEALADELPEAEVRGIAAGLHVTVELPATDDEEAILDEARRRRIALSTLGQYGSARAPGAPTLLVGYGQMPEPAIRPGVHALAEAVRAARERLR
jgi:GntR family transcriptional regulator/MocR family aminotransferase